MASRRSYFIHFNRISSLFLCGVALTCSHASAKADEFSLIPSGNPIYSQLAALDKVQDGNIRSSNLTRYEAALQVARVLATASASPERFSKSNWRTIASLTQSLKTELVSLGVNVESARLQAEKNSNASVPSGKVAPKSATPNLDRSRTGLSTTTASSARPGIGLDQSLLVRGENMPVATSLNAAGAADGSIEERNIVFPISQRLRAGAALVTLNRAQDDLFGSSPTVSKTLGSSTSLAYDFNSWLTVRAQSAQRNLQNTPDKSPLLSAPIFAGANTAKSAGGGVDVNVGSLRVSTDVERFSSDSRFLGTKVGGGVGISAWQNRLSMSAHLSKLVPEDRAVLRSTATELNVGLGISDRLSLNLLYQGLFTRQNTASNERVAGGLSLNF